MNKIVPFGKYKGQPIEILSADKEYTQWLLAQSWLKENYSDTYTFIINNFGEAEDTPEHNLLQSLFLDDEYCRKFIYSFPRKTSIPQRRQKLEAQIIEVQGMLNELLVKVEDKPCPRRIDPSWKIGQIDNLKCFLLKDKVKEKISAEFECGCDVFIEHKLYSEMDGKLSCIGGLDYFDFEYIDHKYRIEVKPSVSDDYPSILRKMKISNSNCLFLETFNSSAITREQFVEIFKRSGIVVVFKEDVK